MNVLQGKVLGNRYVLLEKIGEGGMALVYKAKCELLNRFVAVKILRPEFTSDEEFVKKFKRESLAAASLSHPNIVGIYDVGEQDGIYYIVMEYISGKTLKEYIKDNGKLNYRETLNITNQIANALDNAHKNGVVHRDIKPHNILVTEEKMIKVTDFGIARATSSATMTNTGTVMGSVHYFSPEQARGGYTDHRTDIYSLGVVMYEMLTGSLPYDAESPVTVALKHIQENFVEPILVDNSIPTAVNDIVVKAMEKDMANRYQNVRDMIDDIELAKDKPYQKIISTQYTSELTQIINSDEIGEALNGNKKSKTKQNRKKIAFIVIGIIIAMTALTFLTIYGYNKFFVVKDVTIPHITGLQIDAGKKLLDDNKLLYTQVDRYNNDNPAGQIISSIPAEGSIVKENSEVNVIVSLGAQKIEAPDLSNKNISEIQSILKGLNLSLGKTQTTNSDTIPKNFIVSQNPLPHEQVEPNSSIDVVVSDGPAIKIVVVPVMIGKTLDEVEKTLSNAHLTLGKIDVQSDPNIPDNVVTNIGLTEGTQVAEWSVVDITVNKVDASTIVPPDTNVQPDTFVPPGQKKNKKNQQ